MLLRAENISIDGNDLIENFAINIVEQKGFRLKILFTDGNSIDLSFPNCGMDRKGCKLIFYANGFTVGENKIQVNLKLEKNVLANGFKFIGSVGPTKLEESMSDISIDSIRSIISTISKNI